MKATDKKKPLLFKMKEKLFNNMSSFLDLKDYLKLLKLNKQTANQVKQKGFFQTYKSIHKELKKDTIKDLSYVHNDCKLIKAICGKNKPKHINDLVFIFSFFISKIIVKNNLTEIKLDNLNIGKGILYITQAVKNFKLLRKINLNGNDIPSNHCEAFASCIANNNDLSYVNIADNNFGDKGAKNLLLSLKQCEKLNYLNLSGNNISSATVSSKFFHSVLTKNSNLKYLILQNNILSRFLYHRELV